MSLTARALAAVAAALGAWCVLGVLAVPLPTEAAVRFGLLPSPGLLAGLMAVSLVLLAWRLRDSPRRLPLLLLPLFTLPWWPSPIPAAFVLWTGRIAWLIVALVVVAVLLCGPVRWPTRVVALARDPRRAPVAAAVLALSIFLAGARQLQGMVPGGDEPHYLILTQSLLYDFDLRIENNHQQRDYRTYFGGTLRPHYLRRGQDREIYSVHAPGIPVLVAPAFAIAGYPGAVAFLAILAAGGTALAWWIGWRLTGSAGAAWFGWAAGALASPFTIQAFSVYPDATASVIALVGVSALVLPVERHPGRLLFCGAALALLPWLHSRHAALAAPLALCIAARVLARARSIRPLGWFLAPAAVSAAAWFWFFQVIYGTPSPWAPYGGAGQMSSIAFLPVSLPGLLFDQQFGLVSNAPVLGVALVGLAVLAWRGRRAGLQAPDVDPRTLAWQMAFVCVVYAAGAGTHRMWWAGSSSPARFLTPLVLPLTVPAAAVWAGARSRATRVLAGGTLAATVAITAVFLGVEQGRLAFNWRDGYARLADWLFPAADLSAALPSLIRDPLDLAWARIALWLVAVGVVWLALLAVERAWRPPAGALVLCGCWLGALATMAAASASWRLDSAAALRADSSQTALLRGLASGWRRLGVVYGPSVSRVPSDRLATRLRLETVGRQPLPEGDLLLLAGVPAGRYRTRVALAGPPQGRVTLAIGRGPTMDPVPLEAASGPGVGAEFSLPVEVRTLVVRGDVAARQVIRDVWVEPVEIDRRSRGAPRQAITGARYGSTRVFVLDDGSYVESGGIWVRPNGPTTLVLQSAGGSATSFSVIVRGGPVENACTLDAGHWRERIALEPGGLRQVTVPAAHDGRPTRLSATAERWFRPSEMDSSSGDERQLGCRLEFR